MQQPPIIVVAGPTASGKTRLAVELALTLDGEVLSCDSMQLYRHMDIGTAKPTAEEMRGVPHHMIDVIDPAESFSVGRYVEMAAPILEDIRRRGKAVILCGGTGLYADSLLLGRDFAPMPRTGRREELEALADRAGIEAVIERLRAVDPEAAARLHPSDRKRIIRAMEVYLETGQTITDHDRASKAQPPKYRALWLGLTFADRAALYDRINRRVDQMVEQGLAEELASLLQPGAPPGGHQPPGHRLQGAAAGPPGGNFLGRGLGPGQAGVPPLRQAPADVAAPQRADPLDRPGRPPGLDQNLVRGPDHFAGSRASVGATISRPPGPVCKAPCRAHRLPTPRCRGGLHIRPEPGALLSGPRWLRGLGKGAYKMRPYGGNAAGCVRRGAVHTVGCASESNTPPRLRQHSISGFRYYNGTT